MGGIVRFLAIADDSTRVINWFRERSDVTAIVDRPDGYWVHLGAYGELARSGDAIDAKRSPLAYIVMPRAERQIIWTAGEVSFTPTPLRTQFPKLHAAYRGFTSWLRRFDQVFSYRHRASCKWDYWLEGQLRNFDVDIFALPEAFRALQSGQYFVQSDASTGELDVLCAALRLRGVECGTSGPTRS
jgi:hypothetical protein